MKHDRARLVLGIVAGAAVGALVIDGCSSTPDTAATTGSTSGSGGATASSGPGGNGGHGGTIEPDGGPGGTGGSGGTGGTGGGIPDAGPNVVDDVQINPCGTGCGPTELCDPDHLGLDDDCDGLVDEGCPCAAGEAHPCFKGDPSFHGTAGCFDGSEVCGPGGQWGACFGGVHATSPDNCFTNDVNGCHAITALPFGAVDLKTGTGLFGNNAVVGSESWTVTCPSNVSPCPAVTGASPPDDYKPLQSGEYTVTYTKSVVGQPVPQTCTYPLIVGSRGLRVELGWEHPVGNGGVDLDLHLHQPQNVMPWGISQGKPQDCAWSNCAFSDFEPPQALNAPHWFADPPAMPPTAVNWYLDPVLENNTCYFASGGRGWQSLGMGCHSPRLDSDVISCDPLETDPSASNFCVPENINVDFMPTGEWTRIGVHYYSNHGLAYDVHPTVKVFCDGALAAELGPKGYYSPEAAITFLPSDGSGFGGNRFWVVADVAFTGSACGSISCKVKPVYSDPVGRTPFFTSDSSANSTFAPAYPPSP